MSLRPGLLACLVAATAGAAPPAGGPVEFTRVRVPAGRMDQVPLDGTRHVPMSTAAFDRAVLRLGADRTPAPRPVVALAGYDAAIDPQGRLAGGLEFELDALEAMLLTQVPLGRLDVREATVRTAAGARHAEVFGVPGGDVALRVAGAGRYSCRFVCPADAAGTSARRLALVPALSSTVRLAVPSGMRPVVATLPAGGAVTLERDGEAWLARTGPAAALLVRVVPEDAGQPRFRVWTRAAIAGRRADVAARLVPDEPWLDGAIALVAGAGLTVAEADAPGASRRRDRAAGEVVTIAVPPRVVGTREPIDLFASAPIEIGREQRLPMLAAAATAWAGAGTTVVVDPSLAMEDVTLLNGRIVDPADAAEWPVPVPADTVAPPSLSDDGARPALLHVESQSASATVALRLMHRPAEVDVARVTTVDVSPGAVVGRAACDIRIRAGETFGLAARIAPGWFIDAVEAVDWEADPPPPAASESPAAGRGAVADPTRRIEWRVERGPEAAELRIDLAEAATRNRGLGLRIIGHRRGVPLGERFVTSDMEMVRFAGESADEVLVDFRVGPEAVIEVGGDPIGILAAEGRLGRLIEPGGSRGRIRGGVRSAARDARLVRRRPPLDADVQVQVVARDGQFAESSTFVCRSAAGAIDAIVVHFSEPLGDAVEWTLLEPTATTAVPRRLDAASDAGLRPEVAESWVIEFRPAVEGAVTFRASRTLPFLDAVPATLAWVEGATEERGTLLVRGAGGVRPAVLNRRLWELPPESADARDAAGVVAEFRYAGPDPLLAADPAAEIVPVPSAEARAWAWMERTTAWCHESGGTELETVFDIENRGRGGLTLSVPRGVRVQEVVVAGEPAAFDGGPTSAAELRIEVPQDRVRCEVVVRGVAATSGRAGFWWVDPAPFAIDAPVLGRTAAVMVPAELEVVDAESGGGPSPGWTTRLFDAGFSSASAAELPRQERVGFRRVEASSWGRGRRVCVVRRDLLASLAILAGLATAALAAWLAPRRLLAVSVAGGAAAVAALWLDAPLLALARGAWWGVLAGAALGLARPVRRAAPLLVATAGLVGSGGRAAEPEPYRVYVTEDGGSGTVLVPEPLFRMLASDDAAAAAAVGVRACRVEAPRFDEPWSLSLDVETDQGGVLVMRQEDGGRWSPPRDLPAGVAVAVGADGVEARLVASTPGRRRVVLEIVPAIERRGMVESRRVTLPMAAAATVVSGGDCQCDRAEADGPWTPVTAGPDGFDVSHARAARLVRGTDPRHALAGDAGEVVSLNEVTWSRDRARLRARFDLDGGRSIVRAVVVQAAPGLAPTAAAPATRLSGDRWLVEVPEPRPGRVAIDVDFEMPLASPVGLFDVPFAWLERTAGDSRTVRLRADAEFEAVPELPAGLALVRPREGDSRDAVTWRSDATAGPRSEVGDQAKGLPAGAVAGPITRPRIAVRRRPVSGAVSQRLDLEFAADQVGAELEAEIESLAGPLTTVAIELPADAIVDGCSLWERAGEEDRPVDAVATRPAADRLLVMVQRPRPGRFQLRLTAHIPAPPGPGGAMPLIRCASPAAPLALTWRSTGDVRLDVTSAAGVDGDARQVPAGAAGPLVTVTAREPNDERAEVREPGPAPSAPDTPLGRRLDDATIQVALDGRGRVWGLARFEIAASRPLVTLRMPAGIRPFDILVDGREARVVPGAGDTWEVAVHDIRWPRTLLVVFAGDVGGRLERGDAVRLDPPRIDAATGGEVLWAIDAPDGMRLRAVAPAVPLDGTQWAARRDEARRRLTEAFDAALENVAGPESDRLAAFARRRSAGEMPTLESSWDRGFNSAVTTRARLFVATSGDGSLTVRAAPAVDPTTGARAAATVALLAGLALAGVAVLRWPEWCRAAVRSAWPWGLACAGGLWCATLRPALPGGAMLLVAAVALVARLWPPSRPPSGVLAAEASTRTLLRG